METSYSELRSKFVVNVTDGKNLGRTCDVIFSFPEGKVFGIVVPGKRFRVFKSNDLFIPLKNIVKIGTDVVLVDLRSQQKPDGGKKRPQYCDYAPPPPGAGRRSFEEDEKRFAPQKFYACALLLRLTFCPVYSKI